jgi:hypothetical protein
VSAPWAATSCMPTGWLAGGAAASPGQRSIIRPFRLANVAEVAIPDDVRACSAQPSDGSQDDETVTVWSDTLITRPPATKRARSPYSHPAAAHTQSPEAVLPGRPRTVGPTAP